MIRFDEAIARLVHVAQPLGSEAVPIGAAAGRILAQPVHAAIRAPAADVSTMDGYAVRSSDLTAGEVRLQVAGESVPGALPGDALKAGQCARIFTGAPLPAGADRVVIQEVVAREGDTAVFRVEADEPRYLRAAGSDFAPGDLLVPAGRRLTPRVFAAAAAGDVGQAQVFRRPRLALIATGDELAAPGTAAARPGAVPDSISDALAAFAVEWGAEVGSLARLPDDLEQLGAAAAHALAGADLVVVTGGASVGARDHARTMFGAALDLIFSKLAIKPGKPVWLARAGGALVLGLPGNPTSALVTARLFLAPLLAGLTGRDPQAALGWRSAPLGEPLGPTGERETFARGRLEGETVRLLPNQDSGAQRMLADADLLVRRPIGAPGFAAGDPIQVLDF